MGPGSMIADWCGYCEAYRETLPKEDIGPQNRTGRGIVFRTELINNRVIQGERQR